MSHHIFPCAGRNNFTATRKWDRDRLLAPLTDTSVVNSGWNDPVFVPLSSMRKLLPPKMLESHWESPTVNVLPTEMSSTAAKPFGASGYVSQPRPQMLPPLPRTPIQSMGARNEHWYSDPIHGVFGHCVPEASGRWTTSNRNVFCQRDGVSNSAMSASLRERLTNASNGIVQTSQHGFAKPHLSRSHHCWERLNPTD